LQRGAVEGRHISSRALHTAKRAGCDEIIRAAPSPYAPVSRQAKRDVLQGEAPRNG
jgi:hypothetical protein